MYRLEEVGRAEFRTDDRFMYEGGEEVVPVASVTIAEEILVGKSPECDIVPSSQ